MNGAGTLHGLLRRSAEREPGRAAFVARGQTTLYAELELASSRLAAAFARLGVKKGDRIALVLDADVRFLVAYYAVLKAGAVVVPLPAETKSGSLVYALSHAGAKAAVMQGQSLAYLSGHAAELPLLALLVHHGTPALLEPGHFQLVEYDALLAERDELTGGDASEDDLLSITYTSGTTGRPKGVMLSHKNLVSNLSAIIEYLELTSDDRVAMVLPFHYAYGNSVLHTHIAAGATIVHAGSLAFPTRVLEIIARERCTGFSGVPATFARLLSVTELGRHDLRSVRYLTQAGAAMTPALTQRLQSALPHARLFVMYGMTEASARLAYVPPEELANKLGSAGKAIPRMKLKIVDAEGRVLPPRGRGEVVAEGDSIMLGYWQDPEATARALRPDGLHTGDLGYQDEDGYLFISGRENELIKSGAHRISPHEIESVIERVAGVRECAVVGIPDELLGQAIVACVVANDDGALPREHILRACNEELPRYKLPGRIVWLQELPRTASGKLMRSRLLELMPPLLLPPATSGEP